MNMGKLGNFTFYIKKNEYKKLTETFSVSFGSFKPIKGQETLTDSGGYEHKITLNGVAVVQPIGSLKTLESMAKNREVIRLTTVDIDIDVEKFAYKFEYPAPGKTVGLVHDYYKNKYKGPIVSVGHGPDFIILRANEKSVELGFDVIKLCKFLEEKVPDAGVLGGGHEDAGSIKFIEGRKDKIMKSLDVYFKTLMNINRD